MAQLANQRISKTGLYVEPLLMDIIKKRATAEGESVNGWIRKSLIAKLHNDGHLDQDALLRLAQR